MPNDLKLSVSKCKTFVDCKKKFKYSYILKLPKKVYDFHILGKFCHKVLEVFHNTYIKGCLLPYNVVMTDAFKQALTEYSAKMTLEMKKECREMMSQYLQLVSKKKNNNLPDHVIGVEKWFEMPLNENLFLRGAIDRIQIDDDNVIHVADYKTTKNKKFLKDDYFQLATYAYVLHRENPDIVKVRGSYMLLRHNFELLTKEFELDEILAVKDKYMEYAKNIETEQEFAANPTILCRWCDFSDVCVEGKVMLEPSQRFGETTW